MTATDKMREVASGLQFPEGPVAMPDGSVVLVEIKRGTVSRMDHDGAMSVVAAPGGGPNGAALGPDGLLYVCNSGGFSWSVREGCDVPGEQPPEYSGGRIQRVDLSTGAVEDVYTACGDVPLRGPNDLVFDDAGGFYFTDTGKAHERKLDRGAVYYATPDGSSIVEVAYPLERPNGVGLSPAGDRLYVSETHTGRIWSWPVEGRGRLGRHGRGPAGAGLLYATTGFQPLDSLAVDAEGCVCAATLMVSAITVVSPDGRLVEVVKVPGDDLFVTNICFGGNDLRTAYVTSGGRGKLFATRWPRPGLPLQWRGRTGD